MRLLAVSSRRLSSEGGERFVKTMSSTSKNERLLEKSEKIKEQLRSKIEEVDQLSQKLRRVTVAIGQEMEKEREELAQELEKVLDQSEERGSSKSGSGTARPFWERFIGASFSFGLLFFTARQFYLDWEARQREVDKLPESCISRALNRIFDPQIGESSGSEFADLKPRGFENLSRVIEEAGAGRYLAVVNAEPGIGKSFALQTFFKDQIGVVFFGFKRLPFSGPVGVLNLALGLPPDSIQIEGVLLESLIKFREARGYPATFVLDDIHAVLESSKWSEQGRMIVATFLDLFDRGLLRLVLAGHDVEKALDAADVPGRTRVMERIDLQAASSELVEAALRRALTSAWKREPNDGEMKVMSLLVGHRFTEIGTLVANTPEKSLAAAGKIITKAVERLENARKENEFVADGWFWKRNLVKEALSALLCSEGELRGRQISEEWLPALRHLDRWKIVRLERVPAKTEGKEWLVRYDSPAAEIALQLIMGNASERRKHAEIAVNAFKNQK